MYDLNVCVDINGGRLNKKRDNLDKKLGYFAGIGLGIINTSDVGFDLSSEKVSASSKNLITVKPNEYWDDKVSAKTAGFMIHAGATFPFKFSTDNEKNMGLRLFVKPGFGNHLTFFGVNAFLSVGKSADTGSKKKKKKK